MNIAQPFSDTLPESRLLGIRVADDNELGALSTARQHTKKFVTVDERAAFLAGMTYALVMHESGHKLKNFERIDCLVASDVRPFRLILRTDVKP